MTTTKTSLLDEQAVKNFLEEQGEKPYRLAQITQAVYRDLVTDISDITTLPEKLRSALAERFIINPLTVSKDLVSTDGTRKLLFHTHDGHPVEAVLMRHKTSRLTLCISSQVGCPVKCVFCSTGTMGFSRNLTAAEIAGQLLYMNQELAKSEERVRNIVFMGMGEPLLNYDAMLESLRMMNNQKKFEIGIRHITISTSGIIPKIYELIDLDLTPNLAVSLHAPNDALRTSIMPINKGYPLAKLMEALDAYIAKTDKRVFYEYIMLKGKNDKIIHAKELAQLIKHQHAHVNLIPFNPGGSLEDLQASDRSTILAFQKELQHYHIPCTIRYTFGQDIDAACGQLAAKDKDNQES